MKLREEFAVRMAPAVMRMIAQADPELLSRTLYERGESHAQFVAAQAYDYAEALLAECAKRAKGTK